MRFGLVAVVGGEKHVINVYEDDKMSRTVTQAEEGRV